MNCINFAVIMTITFDLTTPIICGILLLLAVLTPLFSAFFRHIKGRGATTPKHVPVSIIMTVHDDAEDVSRHLPLFLQQQSEAGYEVIVVDESTNKFLHPAII